jgi:hypothetical protein
MNSTRVEFGADSAGAMPTPFKVLSIEAKSAPLDYSVLRLSGDASRFGRYHIGAAVGEKTDVLIIQHPDGRIKRAAFPPNCVVASPQFVRGIATLVDFRHNCDTLGGSSGSPVLDWAGLQVVGLHHWTYLKGVPGSLNQAVHITFIVDDLKEQVRLKKVKPAVVDELLRPRQPS